MQAPKTEDFVWLVEKNFAGESTQLLKCSSFDLETFCFFFNLYAINPRSLGIFGGEFLFFLKNVISSFHNIFPTSLSVGMTAVTTCVSERELNTWCHQHGN